MYILNNILIITIIIFQILIKFLIKGKKKNDKTGNFKKKKKIKLVIIYCIIFL